MATNERFAGAVSEVADAMRKNWMIFFAIGIAMVILGMLAVALPHLATLAVDVLVGWLFLFGGIAQLFHAVHSRKEGGLPIKLFGAALYLAASFFLLVYPLQGEITLTFFLALFFFIGCLFRVRLASSLKPARGWKWIFMGGMIDLALGIFIIVGLPSTAGWAIGLLVGIDFLFAGWAIVMFSLGARRC